MAFPCAGCGKHIPKNSAYRIRDDKKYCARCWKFCSIPKRQTPDFKINYIEEIRNFEKETAGDFQI